MNLPLMTILCFIRHTDVSAFSTYRDLSESASPIYSSVDFLPHSSPSSLLFWSFTGRYPSLVLHASSDKGSGDGGGGNKKGYRFGDITKSLIGGSVEKVRFLRLYVMFVERFRILKCTRHVSTADYGQTVRVWRWEYCYVAPDCMSLWNISWPRCFRGILQISRGL